MKQYLELIRDILTNGSERPDRTGTGTRSVFGRQLRFNLADGFPLVTTKKVPFRLPAEEMLWFLSPDCGNNNKLREKNIHIWDEWESPQGDLGRIYGKQWRQWQTYQEIPEWDYDGHMGYYKPGPNIDQVAEVIKQLKEDPYSRRLIVEGWNVSELQDMALPPCHKSHQLYVADNKLSLMLYQRSSDVGLGLPFNVCQYALLTHMYAHVTGLGVGDLIVTLGDAHVYNNHIEALSTQLDRDPRPLPILEIVRQVPDIDSFTIDDFKIIGYDPHPHIKMDVSV